MTDTAIQIEHLSKRYRLGASTGIAQLLRRGSHLDALHDVSFEVARGEAIGIIGRNGAGKSTLLKILSQITPPSSGRVMLRGRVASLLEVGTGFHPELSGRENIYLNGSLLGLKRREIKAKFDQITEFSGVEHFLDTPVKRYSSGMRVRLAFAVAAHLEPEILVVDEVLAVGDAAFQQKCIGKMQDVASGGRTVLFVSHNMGAVTALCSQAVLLESGRLQQMGPSTEIVRAYQSHASHIAETTLADRQDRRGDGSARLTAVRLFSSADDSRLRCNEAMNVELEYRCRAGQKLGHAVFAITVADMLGRLLFTCSSRHRSMVFEQGPTEGRVTCHLPRLPLAPGEYLVHLALLNWGQQADVIENAATINVEPYDPNGSGRLPQINKHGPLLVDHDWDARIQELSSPMAASAAA